MKTLAKALGLCTLAATTLVSAWNPCCWDGCFSVGAEALWWKPSTCNYEYATLTHTTLGDIGQGIPAHRTVHVESVKPSNDWGFRIFGGYESDCYFASLSWTYLKPSSASSTRRNPQLGATQVLAPTLLRVNPALTFETATGRLKHRYNNVVLRGGFYLHKTCDFAFYTFAGARYVGIDQNRQLTAADNQQVQTRQYIDSQTKGGALEIGLGGSYDLGCCFDIVGHIAGVALIADQKLHARQSSGVGAALPPLDVRYGSTTHCFPGFELRIGFAYSRECSCVTLAAELGYQIDYYIGALATIDTITIAENPQATVTNLFTRCSDVGFGGPYIGLKLCF